MDRYFEEKKNTFNLVLIGIVLSTQGLASTTGEPEPLGFSILKEKYD